MKKLILCLLAFSFLTFVSCKKDEPVNPAAEFVGDYTVSGTLTLNLPSVVGGTQSMPIPNTDLTIALKEDKGDVTLTVGENSYNGYVTETGLHIDPIVVNYPIMQTNIDMTVTIPTVEKPVNGKTSFQAAVSATASGITITGTADVVATKKAAANN